MAKIPPHATRVFKGEIFDVYQWQQAMFDGSTATFERLKRPNTVVVIPVSAEGQIYYSLQEQPDKLPYYGLFGGRSDPDEAPLTTAKRELLEETGMTASHWENFMVFKTPGKIDWEIHYFIAKGCQKVQEPELDGGEKIQILPTDPETFLREIVPHPMFAETELRTKLYSSFNPTEADMFKVAIA